MNRLNVSQKRRRLRIWKRRVACVIGSIILIGVITNIGIEIFGAVGRIKAQSDKEGMDNQKELRSGSAGKTAEKAEKEKAKSKEKAEGKIAALKKSLPDSAVLKTELMLQEPELPTGCESVALTMALDIAGFQLDKTVIADEYLRYDEGNFAKGYMGNPYSESGAGIFPPGIKDSANDFFKENNSDIRAYDISGTDFEDLYAYVAAGYPVVIWITMNYDSPDFTGFFVEADGVSYEWYSNEHCVVFNGYDLDQNTVNLLDPINGAVEIEDTSVKWLYDVVGEYAVTMY